MITADRSKTAGPYLEWKVRIFTVGAVFAVAGMYLDERWMTGVAILVLVIGLVIRMVLERTSPGIQYDDEDGVEDDGSVVDSDG